MTRFTIGSAYYYTSTNTSDTVSSAFIGIDSSLFVSGEPIGARNNFRSIKKLLKDEEQLHEKYGW